MDSLKITCIGVLLVIIGGIFSLFGNIGSFIGFLIGIMVVAYIIRGELYKKRTNYNL